MWFKVYAGLAGGFGGADFIEVEEFDNEEEAWTRAWERACEEYEGYCGLYGLRTLEEIMEEDGVSEEEAEETYSEERESWLDYRVEQTLSDNEEEEI